MVRQNAANDAGCPPEIVPSFVKTGSRTCALSHTS
jgi:hypothetical protein